MTTSTFSLHVPSAENSATLVQFEAVEYANLRQAAEAVIGKYGFKLALEIFGRAFVLTAEEAQRFGRWNLPFIMGIANKRDYMMLQCNENCRATGVRWLTADELPNDNDAATESQNAEERHVSSYEKKATDGSLKMRDEIVEFLGTKVLGLETLEIRKSDRLDFHEVAVWSVKEALELAYLAGQQSSK